MGFSESALLRGYEYGSGQRVLIDVGAHRGSFSVPFARRNWRIVAFEPEINNFAALKRTLGGFKQVVCIDKAVSDTSGAMVPFYISNEHYGIHSLKPFHESHQREYEVKTVRLEDALRKLDIGSVTLLKIDVEGADFLALRSFDFDHHRPEIVMVEFMDERSKPNFGYSYHDMVNYMANFDYVTFVSEWAPITEYARLGKFTNPHSWLRCAHYPLTPEPSWGNLIFIPATDEEKFRKTLSAYLGELERQAEYSKTILGLTKSQLKKYGARIPGAKRIYRLVNR